MMAVICMVQVAAIIVFRNIGALAEYVRLLFRYCW